jgi:DUF1365 family protein
MSMGPSLWPQQALIGRGLVRHQRLRPALHAFDYRCHFLMLPMRQLREQPCTALNRNRWGWLSFHDRDHGDGGPDALVWLDALLASEGISDADGEVWLHCFARVLGYAFKPVSFWYCHRADQSLAAIVVEVNNTFGERHCYLLQGEALGYGRELQASKVFHVSPFCSVDGQYRFRFMHSSGPGGQARTVARIDHANEAGALLQTSVSGRLAPLSAATARSAFWALPAFSLMLILHIHWQALRLWLKRVPFFRKPAPPARLVTR